MRAAYVAQSSRAHHVPAVQSNRLDSGLRIPQTLLRLQSLRDRLIPWLNRNGPHHKPLVPMLKALKSAAESALETHVSAAEYVVPFPITEDYRMAFRSAFSSVFLRMPNSALPPAGILAARAHGLGSKTCLDNPDDDPPQLVLAVEYSRAALTALLLHEECGVFEDRRILHDTGLGLSHLRTGSKYHRDKLEVSLKNLVRLPMNDGGGGGELKYINNLVFLGESAGDEFLHGVLKKVLGEQYDRLVATADQSSSGVITPLFAASRGVAFDCWDRLNFRENER